MEKMKGIKGYRDILQEIVGICDEMIELEKKEEEGHDISKELESLTGRYLIKHIELEALVQ